jgi:hypothetical protein
MNRHFPGVALALAFALGCADGIEIPTVEFGGSAGARLMNGQAKTPAEAYDKAYSQMSRAHYNVRRNLDSRSQNQLGAREALKQIVNALDTMRACVPAADRPRFDPYLARYRDWLKELESGTWGGSFLTDFERAEHEVKSKFNPSSTDVLAEFPNAATPPKPAARPAAEKPAEPAFSPDKVEVPVAKNPPPAEPVKPAPPPPPATLAASTRILYKAWSAAHDDLTAGYREKKPCKSNYEVVIESLRLMKAQLEGEKASKLQIYIDYYGGVEEKTRGFTALPAKTTEKDIVDELDMAARVIRKEFNPDK